MSSLIHLSASALAKGIRNKQFSSVEVITEYLEQIRTINPLIHAVTQIDEEQVLEEAKQADHALELKGPLHGVPFTVKEWIETSELYSTSGMEERKHFRASRDASVVARLKQAGGILLARTNVPLAGTIDSPNPLFGKTYNPHDIQKTSGGSSSGEAALIAAHASCLGIGSDSGGSLRIPAHCCGVSTLKPTTGRIPSTGHYPLIGGARDPRSQIGPMARSSEDLFLAFQVMQGSDGHDPYSIDMPVLSPYEVSLKDIRIAYFTTCGNISPDEDTLCVIEETVRYLSKYCKVCYAQPPRLQEVLPITRFHWNSYSIDMPASLYFKHLAQWDDFRIALLEYMQGYDAILCPTMTTSAPLCETIQPEDYVFTLLFSLTGWPCVSVPAGRDKDNMPIGVQIAARPFREDIVLAIAQAIEQMPPP